MAVNEVALSFEQSEYYTLQEACDYLNLKHGTNNLNIKKIFNHILKYQTSLYFYAKGFEVTVDFGVVSSKFSNYDREHVIKVAKKSSELIDTVISDGGGLLLLLAHDLVEKLRFSETAVFYQEDWVFLGALHFENLQGNPFTFDFLPIGENSDVISGVSCIYPIFKRYSEDTWKEIFEKSSLKAKEYYIIDGGENEDVEYAEVYCEIRKDDLIILHRDLIELENNIISNNSAPQRPIEIKPKKGVSIHKLQAKKYAKLLAKALWNNDKENKIRIAEMASIVYAELYNNGFIGQLPQNQDSLQDWIKDIAPPYARQGGRPTNN